MHRVSREGGGREGGRAGGGGGCCFAQCGAADENFSRDGEYFPKQCFRRPLRCAARFARRKVDLSANSLAPVANGTFDLIIPRRGGDKVNRYAVISMVNSLGWQAVRRDISLSETRRETLTQSKISPRQSFGSNHPFMRRLAPKVTLCSFTFMNFLEYVKRESMNYVRSNTNRARYRAL